jgi:K(+)-stimulated pyrophosphate-energized sodium pump
MFVQIFPSSNFNSISLLIQTLLSPLAVGFGLGRRVVAGYLIGLIVSGIQFSLSGIISAQVWKNAKKMIESGSVSDEGGKVIARGTDCHKASLIGR